MRHGMRGSDARKTGFDSLKLRRQPPEDVPVGAPNQPALSGARKRRSARRAAQ